MVRSLVRGARRGGVFVVGALLVGVGVVLLLMPGPGLLVIALGFAVLATEFRWARRVRDELRRRVREAARAIAARRTSSRVVPHAHRAAAESQPWRRDHAA